MKCVNFLAVLLMLIGAINWGLWGFFQFDLVAWVAHSNTSWVARLIYAIIGLAGVWNLKLLCRCKAVCGCCSKGNHDNNPGGSCKM